MKRRSFFKRALALAGGMIALKSFGTPKEQPQFGAKEIRTSGYDFYNPIDSWKPNLTLNQEKVFNDRSAHVLAYGSKCSGKQTACLHALISHCYWEKDAFALILCESKGRIAFDLEYDLSLWKEGMGLDFTPFKLDANTKDRMIYIGNRHGGWSKVVIKSVWEADQCAKSMIAMSPSLVYHHNATETENDDRYFSMVVNQLGRRRGIEGPQQYYASGVPTKPPIGKNHWVYRTFFQSGEQREGFSAHQFSLDGTFFKDSDGAFCEDSTLSYRESLKNLFTSPVDRARYIEGRWV